MPDPNRRMLPSNYVMLTNYWTVLCAHQPQLRPIYTYIVFQWVEIKGARSLIVKVWKKKLVLCDHENFSPSIPAMFEPWGMVLSLAEIHKVFRSYTHINPRVNFCCQNIFVGNGLYHKNLLKEVWGHHMPVIADNPLNNYNCRKFDMHYSWNSQRVCTNHSSFLRFTSRSWSKVFLVWEEPNDTSFSFFFT